MPDSRPNSSEDERPWIRGKRYRQKYDIGATTFWKWRKAGRVEIREVDGCIYVRDALPADTSNQK
jgi:hypothetical protein